MLTPNLAREKSLLRLKQCSFSRDGHANFLRLVLMVTSEAYLLTTLCEVGSSAGLRTTSARYLLVQSGMARSFREHEVAGVSHTILLLGHLVTPLFIFPAQLFDAKD